MRVLLIKTSSLGDIVHTLPALTDAMHAIPDLRVDWVVEENFADLVVRHPAVAHVIPCALRRWRKRPVRSLKEWREFKRQVKAGHYDAVIDAQGLLKSSFITRLANGPKFGLDKQSAREPLSARVLDCPQAVPWGQHAILRLRQLFAQSLGYTLPNGAVDYGLARQQRTRSFGRDSQLIFFHGTTWASKHWPEDYWRELVTLATADGCRVLLPWGNDEEKSRAERLAQGHEGASVLPHLSLSALFDLLLTLDGFVAVDTGLAHLAAAAGLAGVALYGPTDPALTGVIGVRAKSLAVEFPCAPCRRADCHYNGNEGSGIFPACFSSLPPEWVWQQLQMVSHSGAL